jgi:small-conductance mechanosensitive channel
MPEIHTLLSLMQQFNVFVVGKGFLILIIGYVLARLARNGVGRIKVATLTVHSLTLLKRVVFYGILVLTSISVMKELGFDLSVVLGAAGIFSVAIGFASQTSASNLISGLFLMMERPFSIGDIIKVESATGEVIAIDLLSVKIRTFDNLFVRIPNESMIKTQVTTLTKFPIRRADLQLKIAYKEDIERVKEVLNTVSIKNTLCLDEPAPLFILLGFGSSSVDIQYSVWATKANFLTLKNSMYQEIKNAFDQQNIEIPFPHINLISSERSTFIPVSIDDITK